MAGSLLLEPTKDTEIAFLFLLRVSFLRRIASEPPKKTASAILLRSCVSSWLTARLDLRLCLGYLLEVRARRGRFLFSW